MLGGVKSKNVLKKIFEVLIEKKYLEILRYNKKLQKMCNITFDDYE